MARGRRKVRVAAPVPFIAISPSRSKAAVSKLAPANEVLAGYCIKELERGRVGIVGIIGEVRRGDTLEDGL